MNSHRLFFLLVGLLDFFSGWALMLFPETIQAALLVNDPLPDPSSRLIGSFVAGLGTVYLWAASRPGAGEKRLWHTFALTSVLRLYIGVAFLGLIMAGSLGPVWLVVGCTDLGLALIQALWWKRWKDRQASI